MRAKVQIYEAKDGWRWRIRARNGRIIAESGEAYKTRFGAIRGVSTIFYMIFDEDIAPPTFPFIYSWRGKQFFYVPKTQGALIE